VIVNIFNIFISTPAQIWEGGWLINGYMVGGLIVFNFGLILTNSSEVV
jgi:hypothetical protein